MSRPTLDWVVVASDDVLGSQMGASSASKSWCQCAEFDRQTLTRESRCAISLWRLDMNWMVASRPCEVSYEVEVMQSVVDGSWRVGSFDHQREWPADQRFVTLIP